MIAIPENEEQANAYFYARKYLNAAIQFALPSNPLSLEQLRKVPHGKIKDSTLQSICDRANEVAQPPAHIDREMWTAKWIYPENEFNLPKCSKCGKEISSVLVNMFNYDGTDSFYPYIISECEENAAYVDTTNNWTGYELSEE